MLHKGIPEQNVNPIHSLHDAKIKIYMQVICLEEAAFYELVEQVVKRITDIKSVNSERWITDERAMGLLNIKSKSTLQKLRDEGEIRFSQPQKKIILYDKDSIEKYLDKHARNTF